MRFFLRIALALFLTVLSLVLLSTIPRLMRLAPPAVPAFDYWGEPRGYTLGDLMLALGDPTSAEYHPDNVDVFWGNAEADINPRNFSPYSTVDYFSDQDSPAPGAHWRGYASR